MKNENSGGRELRVLLIDDDPGDLHLISEALKNYDSGRVEILKSRRFSDGLSRIAVDRPDVILLDLGLPDSTGLESVREILAASPGLPVIILTGLDDEELGPMAVREGAQDYVVKEYADRNLMSHVLRHSVERQGLVNRLERQGKTVLAAHENLKSVIEASGDAILVCEPEGRILFANPMGERLFNGDGNRLIGTSFGFPLTADKKTEIQIPSPGNPVVSAEMHVVDITWHGDPARMVTLHDTTVRKAAEAELSATNRALRASEERFRAFMNASPESMLLKDRDGRYLAVNKEWELRYGKSAKNVIGRLSSDIFPLKKAKRVKTQDDEVFSSGIVCYFEADEVDSAGTKLVEKVVKFPIRDNQGAIVALGGISFDVTDLKRAQEALQRSNRTLRTLSAGNRALVHAKTEESLIANVCKLIVELSGYPFVWVGFTEGEKETALVTVAQYG
ncbi:MAG: PAS domain S-box protein, partial [Rhodospirillales bacterium]|nr:PAS domain S-box protein [Rhodospirillales bacterium]